MFSATKAHNLMKIIENPFIQTLLCDILGITKLPRESRVRINPNTVTPYIARQTSNDQVKLELMF